jgi:hypothetical protein
MAGMAESLQETPGVVLIRGTGVAMEHRNRNLPVAEVSSMGDLATFKKVVGHPRVRLLIGLQPSNYIALMAKRKLEPYFKICPGGVRLNAKDLACATTIVGRGSLLWWKRASEQVITC